MSGNSNQVDRRQDEMIREIRAEVSSMNTSLETFMASQAETNRQQGETNRVLTRAVEKITDTLFSLGKELHGEVEEAKSSLHQRIDEQKRLPWPLITVCGGFLIASVGWAATVIDSRTTLEVRVLEKVNESQQRDIDRNEADVTAMWRQFHDHVRDGHPRRVEQKADANLARINKIDAALDEINRTRFNGDDGDDLRNRLIEVIERVARLEGMAAP